MIYTRLSGGLGNQLFQYAAGRSLAVQNNTNLFLDLSELQKTKAGVTSRQFELSHFQYRASIASPPKISTLPLFRKYVGALTPFLGCNYFIEKSRSYSSEFRSQADNTFLIGYWQSHLYFEAITEVLFEELQPAEPLTFESEVILQKIKSVDAVGIHIRRGDYLSLGSANSYHGCLDFNYYLNAIEWIRLRSPSSHFFIFSDDSSWCSTNFAFLSDSYTVVDCNSGSQAWQDLILMSWCPDLIIANSSFSWWSAWLSDYRFKDKSNRLVVAPVNWFVKTSLDEMKFRVPSNWILR